MNGIEINQQASNIFRKAAMYIRTYGWQVTGMSKYGLPRCSMGALASAHNDVIWNKELAEFMYEKLYEELDGLTLTEFNYKYRSGEKVAELFDKVAKNLTNRHDYASCKVLTS